MKITIEQYVARNGRIYWVAEHDDTHYRMTFDLFADVLEYLDVWRGIQGVS